MNLKPEAPFIWPDPRVLMKMCDYEHYPPFSALALKSNYLFGIVTALTTQGIDILKAWMEGNANLKVDLIVMVYPACATKQADLYRLLELVEYNTPRLSVHVSPLEKVTDRATNTLCCLPPDTDVVYILTGAGEDFGFAPVNDGHINFAFQGDPILVEGFRRHFDLLWAHTCKITDKGVALIPDLVLPEGTKEAAEQWRRYIDDCINQDEKEEETHAEVNPVTGDVVIVDDEGNEVPPPTADGGLKKLDQLAEFVARLYEKGSLVSVDKLSKIPPLDAPLDPNIFGDVSELQRGNVKRKVSMRVSIIDEQTLREIDKRRQGLRALLAKFTFGLADNMRWMPHAARGLFELELKRINDEGQKLISVLLEGGIDKFIDAKRSALLKDINAMYAELGRTGQVTEDVMIQVIENLKERLIKAQSGNFMPKLTYSAIKFIQTDNPAASPWGQAYSFLADIAAFPREALTDNYFFRGLKVRQNELIEVMNVSDDVICRDLQARGIMDRCKADIGLISRIENAAMDARDRCELIKRILVGDPIEIIDKEIGKKELK